MSNYNKIEIQSSAFWTKKLANKKMGTAGAGESGRKVEKRTKSRARKTMGNEVE